jgi:hypothetical protein
MNNCFPFCRFFTFLNSVAKNQSTGKLRIPVDLGRNWKPIPIPHRTIHEPSGQDLDFINVAHSHLIHSDWNKLSSLSTGLTTLRVKHILLKIQKDHVLSLEFSTGLGFRNRIAIPSKPIQ